MHTRRGVLDALASFECLGLREVARSNVAVWADQSPRSSGYANNLGALRTAGLIDYPRSGWLTLTDAGRQLAHVPEPIWSVGQLHAAWYLKLQAPQARILRALIAAYPGALPREELAARARQSPSSSGYANNLGALRSLGLIDYPRPGLVTATARLFPAQGTP